MGTNFYTADYRNSDFDSMDPEYHVGKRSAAGLYCWDCRQTLIIGGESAVHTGAGAHDHCPQCGAGRAVEDLVASAVGRELGFNQSAPIAKTGVRGCASFTWVKRPEELEGIDTIWDEYGDRYTRDEFIAALQECPIQFFDSIGRWFS